MKQLYMIRVRTNKYAGNFERPFGHYVTGVASEYGMLEKEIDRQLSNEGLTNGDEEWFEILDLRYVDHEHGCDPYLMDDTDTNSINIFLGWKDLKSNQHIIPKLKERIMNAPKFLGTLKFMPTDLEVLDVTLVVETVTEVHVPV